MAGLAQELKIKFCVVKDLHNLIIGKDLGEPSERNIFAHWNEHIERAVGKLDAIQFAVLCAQTRRLGIAAERFGSTEAFKREIYFIGSSGDECVHKRIISRKARKGRKARGEDETEQGAGEI